MRLPTVLLDPALPARLKLLSGGFPIQLFKLLVGRQRLCEDCPDPMQRDRLDCKGAGRGLHLDPAALLLGDAGGVVGEA